VAALDGFRACGGLDLAGGLGCLLDLGPQLEEMDERLQVSVLSPCARVQLVLRLDCLLSPRPLQARREACLRHQAFEGTGLLIPDRVERDRADKAALQAREGAEALHASEDCEG